LPRRFRTLIWTGAVCRILRRAIIESDRKALTGKTATHAHRPSTPSTFSNPSTPKKKTNVVRKDAECGTPSKMIAKHFSSLSLVGGGGGSPSKRTLPASHYDHSRAFSLSSDRESDRAPTSDEDSDARTKHTAKEKEALITKIHSTRTHISTDGILEYRLEIAPAQLVRLVEAGIKGTRVEPEVDDIYADYEGEEELGEESDGDDGREDGGKKSKAKRKATGKGKATKKAPAHPDSHLRVWMPACMVNLVEPGLVEEYEEKVRLREERKAGRGKGRKGTGARKKKEAVAWFDEPSDDGGKKKARGAKKKTKAKAYIDISDSDSMDSDNIRNNLKGYLALNKPQSKVRKPTVGTDDSASESSNPQLRASKVRSKPPPIPHVPLYDSDSESESELDSECVVAISPTRALERKSKSSPAIMRISDILTPVKKAKQAVYQRVPSPTSGRLEPQPFPLDEYDFGFVDDAEYGFVDDGGIGYADANIGVVDGAPDGFVDNDFDFNFNLVNFNDDENIGMNVNDDPFLDDEGPPTSRTLTPHKQSRKKVAQSPSESDTESWQSRAKKSPRKSKKHTSPKHSPIRSEQDSDDLRPGSPSPMRIRPKDPISRASSKQLPKTITKKAPKANDSIIEISSEEDAPASRTTIKLPLLAARSKKIQRNTETKRAPNGVVKPALALSDTISRQNDIIDLT
jgi:Holliday junction resolvase YEN1